MAFKLDEVVPWGRCHDEYLAMFSLDDPDLEKQILGCGDGPASFNAEATTLGRKIVSIDPIYVLSGDDIRKQISKSAPTIIEQVRENYSEFTWTYFDSIEELISTRMDAMDRFLNDYSEGRRDGRYIDASLPSLPFPDRRFDIALCSHFLFLYSEQTSADFHVEAIKEMCRVASDVRVFPLLELGSVKSRYIDSVLDALSNLGFTTNIVPVDYEFQLGGNEMLQIHAA